LNLAKRTVSEATETAAASTPSDSKASPFGAARPIDTAAREREIEERRQKEKLEAEEKAKQEKLAKEAAAKEAAEKAAAEAEAKAKEEKEAPAEEAKAAPQEGAANEAANEQKVPIRTREPREAPKSRAVESGNWRSASGEQRAPSRGGHVPSGPRRGGPTRGPRDNTRPARSNGTGPAQQPQSPTTEQAPPTPTVDEDGWTTVVVPSKGRRGQSNRP
jgi:translation initiation factor 4B